MVCTWVIEFEKKKQTLLVSLFATSSYTYCINQSLLKWLLGLRKLDNTHCLKSLDLAFCATFTHLIALCVIDAHMWRIRMLISQHPTWRFNSRLALSQNFAVNLGWVYRQQHHENETTTNRIIVSKMRPGWHEGMEEVRAGSNYMVHLDSLNPFFINLIVSSKERLC